MPPSPKPFKFWWTEPASVYIRAKKVKPYLTGIDAPDARLNDMGNLNLQMMGARRPLVPEEVPQELRWMVRHVTETQRRLGDACKIFMGGLLVSEDFKTTVSKFDLGRTQFFELPLYEAASIDKMGNSYPDRTKQDPRRWYLMHLTDYKPTLRPDHSKDIRELTRSGEPRWKIIVPGKPTIAVDADAASAGPDIWREQLIPTIICFSDPVKKAIKSAKLRTPALAFKPCRVI